MICTAHFLNIKQDYAASKTVIIKISNITDYVVITYNNITKAWTADTAGKNKVMIRKISTAKFSKYDKAGKERKMYEGRIKTALRSIYIKIIPCRVISVIKVLFKNLNFGFSQVALSLYKLLELFRNNNLAFFLI